MKRNLNATCGTCPYWQDKEGTYYGLCKCFASDWQKSPSEWCGQHPDFFDADIDGAEADIDAMQATINRYSQAYTESLEREKNLHVELAQYKREKEGWEKSAKEAWAREAKMRDIIEEQERRIRDLQAATLARSAQFK